MSDKTSVGWRGWRNLGVIECPPDVEDELPQFSIVEKHGDDIAHFYNREDAEAFLEMCRINEHNARVWEIMEAQRAKEEAET